MINSLSRRQFFSLAGAATVVGLGLAGCSSSSNTGTSSNTDTSSSISGSITAVGSTALQPLVEAASEQFMTDNPNVQITVQGGGSGQGITQIAQGSVQIGDSDVFAEAKITDASVLAKLTDNKVAVVGMGPVVNTGVAVNDLTIAQLKSIFTGAVTNWKDLGGDDAEIVVINRASGSGTRATFEGAVLGGDPVPASFTPQEQDSSGTVAKMIADTPNSISYLAFSYFNDTIKALSVGGVKPEEGNVETNKWTIWAYEHMYTAASPDAATQAFIDYMLGDDVQGSLVEQTGYISVSGMKVARDADGTITSL